MAGTGRTGRVEPHLNFQQATEQDVHSFLALERGAGDPRIYGPFTELEDALREINTNTLLFIRVGDTIVGMASYRIRPDKSVYIGNVAIDPDYRRQGIARAAMVFILDINNPAPRIDLVTHPENEPALRLYLSLGFKVESRQENFFGDGEPRLVLTRNVDHGGD